MCRLPLVQVLQAASGVSVSPAARLAGLDWAEIAASLDEWGYARTPALLAPSECADLRALYADEARFRSRVDMARYRFGVGEYKYFADPLPPIVQEIRASAYPRLAAVANRWEAALKTRARHPADLAGLLALCARRGQKKLWHRLLRRSASEYGTFIQCRRLSGVQLDERQDEHVVVTETMDSDRNFEPER